MRNVIRRLIPAAVTGLAALAGCNGEAPTNMETDAGTNPPGVSREIPASDVAGETKNETLDANGTKRE